MRPTVSLHETGRYPQYQSGNAFRALARLLQAPAGRRATNRRESCLRATPRRSGALRRKSRAGRAGSYRSPAGQQDGGRNAPTANSITGSQASRPRPQPWISASDGLGGDVVMPVLSACRSVCRRVPHCARQTERRAGVRCPFGTVGGRMAGTHRPRSYSAVEMRRVSWFSPTMIGWIAVGDGISCQRVPASPSRSWAISACKWARRSSPCSMRSRLASGGSRSR